MPVLLKDVIQKLEELRDLTDKYCSVSLILTAYTGDRTLRPKWNLYTEYLPTSEDFSTAQELMQRLDQELKIRKALKNQKEVNDAQTDPL